MNRETILDALAGVALLGGMYILLWLPTWIDAYTLGATP